MSQALSNKCIAKDLCWIGYHTLEYGFSSRHCGYMPEYSPSLRGKAISNSNVTNSRLPQKAYSECSRSKEKVVGEFFSKIKERLTDAEIER